MSRKPEPLAIPTRRQLIEIPSPAEADRPAPAWPDPELLDATDTTDDAPAEPTPPYQKLESLLPLPADQPDADATERPNPEPEPIELPPGWHPMAEAPKTRPVWLSDDPASYTGVLAFWRTTRVKALGKIGWQQRSYWAQALNRREIEFEPVAWREMNGGG